MKRREFITPSAVRPPLGRWRRVRSRRFRWARFDFAKGEKRSLPNCLVTP
jgi:hypothetical protein